jgi:hypothetical protein
MTITWVAFGEVISGSFGFAIQPALATALLASAGIVLLNEMCIRDTFADFTICSQQKHM